MFVIVPNQQSIKGNSMSKNDFPSLNALRVFEAVARLHSFKSAAAELGVTQSAVSRQLTTLEQQLGVKLIQRDNRMHALTTAGQVLAPELHRVFRQLERIVTYTINEGDQARRIITIGISHEIYTQWLAPLLEEFKQLYPHLELRFVQLPEYMDRSNEDTLTSQLLRNEIDVLLVFGKSAQKSLLSQVLLSLPLHLYTAAATVSTPAKEFIRIDHQTLPNQLSSQLKQFSALQLERQTSAQSSLMATTLVPVQNAAVILPVLYQQLAEASQLQCHGDIDSNQELSVIIRKEDDRELGMVALLQWLEYRAKRFKY